MKTASIRFFAALGLAIVLVGCRHGDNDRKPQEQLQAAAPAKQPKPDNPEQAAAKAAAQPREKIYRGPGDSISPSAGPAGPTAPAGPRTGGSVRTGAGQVWFGSMRRGTNYESAESYATVVESGFLLTSAAKLSTFAADVDTASFSNLRRFLRDGRLPPPASVRVEEFVNAQSYNDPEPQGRDLFSITTELGACPWQEAHHLLRIGLKTKSIDVSRVPPCNLVFLIDVSGSMSSPMKLPLVRRAMALLVDQLRPQDRVAIVTYASGVELRLPMTPGSEKARIHEVLTNLRTRGGTNGQGGIQLAYEVAATNKLLAGVNRVILATDGDFNVGISDPDDLEKFIAERRDDGVFLTVLGVGSGNLKDDRLERLANRGNGVYAYLDTLAEARRVLIGQFGASMMTVAKDVKLQIEFDPAKVARYRQIGYENRQLAARDFRNDKKDAGEVGAGHSMTALYEIVPAEGATRTGTMATLRIRYKPPLGKTAREVAHEVAAAMNSQPSRDLRVAASAAALGMVLRGSSHIGDFGLDRISALIDDPELDAQALSSIIAKAVAVHLPSK